MNIKRNYLIVSLAALMSLGGIQAFASDIKASAKQQFTADHIKALGQAPKDLIASSEAEDWYQTESGEGQGDWQVNHGSVTVDAFDARFALEGATKLTKQGFAYGAYEFETTIHIQELNAVQNPMVGIIPWYVDDNNYMFVQLKFTDKAEYITTPEETSDGYAVEKILFSGKFDGEAKYYTSNAQQENTTFDSLAVPSLATAKVAPSSAAGHKLKVRFENNSATATSYKVSIIYNDIEVGSSYAYFYNAVAKNLSVGFMGQDVKATFTNAILTDFLAENNNASLARDWKESNNYTYRIQNGVDVWNFKENGDVSFVTDEIKEGSKVTSRYRVTGTNLAGYDTNRGFTQNPYRENELGLPQNYVLSASFKRDVTPNFTGASITQGYGLLAWYKDDMNFIDVTLRISTSGSTLAPTIESEIVLFGWIDGSSSNVGQNVYRLPNTFDPNVNHTLKVAKKSTGFYVYLDEGSSPILSKKVKGTSTNYAYGYEGYNAQFSASAITSEAVYEAYDEIGVLDDHGHAWRVSAKSEQAWVFDDNKISINAKETSNDIGKRSYIIGASDISDRNMSVVANARIDRNNNFSELMLSPYIVDDNNFARIGLVWKDSKVFARIAASTYTEADIDDGLDPKVTLSEYQITNINLAKDVELKATKVEDVIALYVDNVLVYGKEIADIGGVSENYGVYVYNMDLTLNSLQTDGYKKWTEHQVGDWTTSAMKFNAWTINEDGYLAGDATYESHMVKDEEDANRNYALKENPYHDDYDMRVDIKVTKQSEAQDRVGVVMWYVDENNFMLFFIDMWRADSTVPRTTIYGKIEGQTLPTTYNHGGWLPEGDVVGDDGLTATEASQVTNWHTIHVRKQGNTFIASVDNGTGYISYTVAAGLPSTTEKTLYSGVYTYNDAVLVRSYDVTTINGFTTPTLPAPANNPYNDFVEPPVLDTYADNIFIDEFNEFINTEDGDTGTSEPGTSEPPVTSEPNSEDDGDLETRANFFQSVPGIITMVASFAVIASAVGVLVYKKKRKK